MPPLARRHSRLPGEHHRKIVTVFKTTAGGNLTHHQPGMLQQKLGVAHPALAHILIDRHTGLRAELLAQCAFTALVFLAKSLQIKGMIKPGRQGADQPVQHGLLLHLCTLLRGKAMALQGNQ